jgi:hypothetical protein
LATIDGQPTVDSEPLIFFHFHNLRKVSRWLYDPGLADYGVRMTAWMKQQMYGPYLRELGKANQWLSEVVDMPQVPQVPRGRTSSDNTHHKAARTIRNGLSLVMRLLRGQLLVMIADGFA